MTNVTREDVLKFSRTLTMNKGRSGILTVPIKFLVYARGTNKLLEERKHTLQEPVAEGVLTLIKMKAQVDGIPFDEAIMLFVREVTKLKLGARYVDHPEVRLEVILDGEITWKAEE